MTKFIPCAVLTLPLAACGGGEPPVRAGPHAVHPSTSALAQGTATPHCHKHGHKGCHGHAHDGSAPIID